MKKDFTHYKQSKVRKPLVSYKGEEVQVCVGGKRQRAQDSQKA